MLVIPVTSCSEPEWSGYGGAEKITELVDTPGLKEGLALFLVFGRWA